ncbi:MAG: histidine phosphatase family protein [Bacillati bacterium ANGP1]|uniref:Histidine phosphatase family protein n=1 Tax=Candidatus Segetimicrobium genomatis TaxID=2569760 RepID=A0A537J1B2_9BACT|nr:MAG: histidine phosphatase family protein [Terrabacteria group bacterium ANGP1]
MPTRIYLIRHGESTWNAQRRWQGVADAPLSDAGRAEATLLADALHTVPLRAVYCSPLRRAVDTAAVVAAVHRLDVIPVADLREIAFGVWESLLAEEVEQRFGALLKEWWERPDQVQIPGAEPLEAARARVAAAIHGIVARHEDGQVAVVAHGGVNKLLVLTLLDAPLSSYWRMRQDNACVNIVEFDGDRGRVLVLNDTTHLK